MLSLFYFEFPSKQVTKWTFFLVQYLLLEMLFICLHLKKTQYFKFLFPPIEQSIIERFIYVAVILPTSAVRELPIRVNNAIDVECTDLLFTGHFFLLCSKDLYYYIWPSDISFTNYKQHSQVVGIKSKNITLAFGFVNLVKKIPLKDPNKIFKKNQEHENSSTS